MINIKLNSCDIDQAISDYINKELGTKLDFLIMITKKKA